MVSNINKVATLSSKHDLFQSPYTQKEIQNMDRQRPFHFPIFFSLVFKIVFSRVYLVCYKKWAMLIVQYFSYFEVWMKQSDFSHKFFLNFIFEFYVETKKIWSISGEKIDQKVCLFKRTWRKLGGVPGLHLGLHFWLGALAFGEQVIQPIGQVEYSKHHWKYNSRYHVDSFGSRRKFGQKTVCWTA